jgi:large subunit ribosomal protein L10
MPTADKSRTIEQAREWYTKSAGVVFTDYKGLKVKELQELRATLRSKGGELHVLKNTLFRIAAGDDTAKLPADLHNGTTAFTFVFENEAEVTKALLDYAKTSKKLVVKGGFFSGRAFNATEVQALSELPPKDVLISMVIGLIASPISNLVGTIEALYADPIRVIGAVADKVAEGSPAPEAVAEAAAPAEEATVESNSPETEVSPETPESDAAATENTENA